MAPSTALANSSGLLLKVTLCKHNTQGTCQISSDSKEEIAHCHKSNMDCHNPDPYAICDASCMHAVRNRWLNLFQMDPHTRRPPQFHSLLPSVMLSRLHHQERRSWPTIKPPESDLPPDTSMQTVLGHMKRSQRAVPLLHR